MKWINISIPVTVLFLTACFDNGSSSGPTVASASYSGQAALGASLPDANIEYGIYDIATKTSTQLGTGKTDADGNFSFSTSDAIPLDHILYVSVLDSVDNLPIVQSVVFPEDSAKHINVTPHSHLIANLTFNSDASTTEGLKTDYDAAVDGTLQLLQPIADNANMATIDKETLLFQPFEAASTGLDELVESMSVTCDKQSGGVTQAGDCRIKFNSKNIHAAVLGKKNPDLMNSEDDENGIKISMNAGLDSLTQVVDAVKEVKQANQNLFKPVGPVLLVFDYSGKWGESSDPWAGYNGELKIINMTDTPLSLGDYSIQLLSKTLDATSMWGSTATMYPVENDPDKTLFHFTFPDWVLLRSNQHHIIGINGKGAPESVNDIHGCVISNGVDEKKCVVKIGKQAAIDYIEKVSFGDGGVGDGSANPLETAIMASESSDKGEKDASAATGAGAQVVASDSVFTVNLNIDGSPWSTGFNGNLTFTPPVGGNKWKLLIEKPSGVSSIDFWISDGGIKGNKIEVTPPNWGMALIENKETKFTFGVQGQGGYGNVLDNNDCQLVLGQDAYPCNLVLDDTAATPPPSTGPEPPITPSIQITRPDTSDATPVLVSDVPFVPPTSTTPPVPDAGSGNPDIHSAVRRGNGTTQAQTPLSMDFQSPNSFNGKIIAGYISEWSVYGRKFNVERLYKNDGTFPYNKLVVAFLGICGDQGKLKGTIDAECNKQGKKEHEVVFLDPWALFGTTNSDRQKGISWVDGQEKGLMEQLRHLKTNVTGLKISASIGGWTMSEPFHRLAANQTSINTFVESLNTLQNDLNTKYGFKFDGFDIDWEFPGHGGDSGKFTANDGEYFKNLVCAVKTGVTNNEEISSAVGATYNFIEKIGSYYKDIYDNNCLDYLYMMNYDFFGGWDSTLGHQTSLLPSEGFVGTAPTDGSTDKRWSIDASIRAFEENGFMRDRLIMGVANYARGFKSGNLAIDSGSGAIQGTKTNQQEPVGTYEKGVMEGYDLWQNVATQTNRTSDGSLNLQGRGDFVLLSDFNAQADAYYNPVTHDYFSIDTPRTAYIKAKLSDKLGLAGTFVWTVEQDDGKIVTAMQDGFGLNSSIPDDRKALYVTCGQPFNDYMNPRNASDPNAPATPNNPCETLYDGLNLAVADSNSSVKTLVQTALLAQDGSPVVYPSGKLRLMGSKASPTDVTETPTVKPVDQPPPPKPATEFVMSDSIINADKDAAIGSQGQQIQDAIAMVRTLDNTSVEAVSVGNVGNPNNVKRVEGIIDQAKWDFLFSRANDAYTYEKFLKAIAKYPAFCQDYSVGRDADEICKKSLATMFAHFAQETGENTPSLTDDNGNLIPVWRQALYYVREMGWTEEGRDGYNGNCAPSPGNWAADAYPCGTFSNGDYKSYFGRGAKQLSYNYNYGPFSESIYGDVTTLLNNPELVADTWLNIASALFFYVTPQPPKPSMLSVIDGSWTPNQIDADLNLTAGFGATINIINGGLECRNPVTEDARAQNRIDYYKEFSRELGLTVDESTLSCVGMSDFDKNGGGALPIYWDKDWGWDSNRGGPSYRCKLVNYQTAYPALTDAGYRNCVKANFPEANLR